MVYRPSNATVRPPDYQTPDFPSLYWLVGPRRLVHPAYLYYWRDVWRFTLYWTLMVYGAAYLSVSIYAIVIVWWGSRDDRVKGGMGRRTTRGGGKLSGKVSGMWVVPVVYAIVGGLQAVVAGSIVGLILGAVYAAGDFRMSTYIPFVWSLVNLLILIVSSFSIQGGL